MNPTKLVTRFYQKKKLVTRFNYPFRHLDQKIELIKSRNQISSYCTSIYANQQIGTTSTILYYLILVDMTYL